MRINMACGDEYRNSLSNSFAEAEMRMEARQEMIYHNSLKKELSSVLPPGSSLENIATTDLERMLNAYKYGKGITIIGEERSGEDDEKSGPALACDNCGMLGLDDPQNEGNKDESKAGKVVVDNTKEALNHYFNGQGEPVWIGDKTVSALLHNSTFINKNDRIQNGYASKMEGYFSVNMTWDVFHIGRTNVEYSISCKSQFCTVEYKMFARDGFWDPDFIDERGGYSKSRWQRTKFGKIWRNSL